MKRQIVVTNQFRKDYKQAMKRISEEIGRIILSKNLFSAPLHFFVTNNKNLK